MARSPAMRAHIYPQPSQGMALLINVLSVMGKLVVDYASYCLISRGRDVFRRVTLHTRPGEVYMRRHTHGNAVTSRNEAWTKPLLAGARS